MTGDPPADRGKGAKALPGLGPALVGIWRAPHLPFFFLASLWAAIVPLAWFGRSPPEAIAAWHAREMILGVVGAAMAGYLLTALPHWLADAGRRGGKLRSPGLAGLVALWLVGRLAPWAGEWPAVALAGALVFPTVLTAFLALSVLRAKLVRRLAIALAPLGLALAVLAAPAVARTDPMTPMLALALLLAMVGGRVVPAFLRARKEGIGTGTPRPGRLAPADLPLIAAFALQLAGAGTGVTGACLILAGMAQGLRMAAWRLAALRMANASDLMLLVIAWLFLPAGLVLAGVALATGQAPAPGLHAIGMGAMGGLVLAVQSRALMERLPGALRPGGALIASFALVEAAALLRVVLEPGPVTLPFTAGLWSLGWLTTAAAFLFAAAGPLPHPVLSARRPRRDGHRSEIDPG